jgi:hypothetical protein
MTELPPHLDRETVEQYAEESATVLEFTRKCRIGRTPAKRLLRQMDLEREVATAEDLV